MPFATASTDLGALVLGVGLLLLVGGWAWGLRRQRRAAPPEAVLPATAVDLSALTAEQAAQLQPFEQAVADRPRDPIAWYNRATALDQLGQAQAALASYDRALELKPDFPEAWNNRGSLLDDLGRHQEALASYERALHLKPDFLRPALTRPTRCGNWAVTKRRCAPTSRLSPSAPTVRKRGICAG